jgi:hypothetical protein
MSGKMKRAGASYLTFHVSLTPTHKHRHASDRCVALALPVQFAIEVEPTVGVLVLPGHGVHATSFPMFGLYVPAGHGTAPAGESGPPIGTNPGRALHSDLLLDASCSVVMDRGHVSQGRALNITVSCAMPTEPGQQSTAPRTGAAPSELDRICRPWPLSTTAGIEPAEAAEIQLV